jgi:hypothetical protein
MTQDEQAQVDRIWQVIEKAGVCMMAVHFADGIRVRPMVTLPAREENVILCLTDRRGLKNRLFGTETNLGDTRKVTVELF